MRKFILSTKADDDIEGLYDDGLKKFGESQAIKYLEELNLMFVFLSKNSEVGKKRDEIKMKLVSFPIGSHIIFYRIFKTHIRIIRVLYGGKDLVKFLK
ncbi:type II toxin-antitoxin system RelE/ParE family toxin [uncultured Aquimarina sp.]|uniref:type II toxin-antitoxin system RelE/ParE family toxin n=1 Tax=uncultured Aquimarina sp. TaxID=575652 RepID=UPI0026113AF2|nr:type II toxin-antitoxin system RelE/ParE family toxin [uncultured Aquimarina sp.]